MAPTINFLRLLADSTRLRLLLLLEEEELSVAELQEILGMGQSRISSHLAQLKRAGAVARAHRARSKADDCRSWRGRGDAFPIAGQKRAQSHRDRQFVEDGGLRR